MYRIQRTRRTAYNVAIGPVPVAATWKPTGGRFDLPDTPVGDCSRSPDGGLRDARPARSPCAVHRRPAPAQPALGPADRAGAAARSASACAHLAGATSLRFGCTQELAADAVRHGYHGLIYRSAQQHDHDCYVLFGSALDRLRQVERTPLVEAADGGLHRLLRVRGPRRPDAVRPMRHASDNPAMTTRSPLPFTKMHGLGNDFVVFDATRAPLALSEEQLRFVGDRRFGIGADQILVVERPQAAGRRLPLPHLQRRHRRGGGALRQRRALLHALRAREGPDRPGRRCASRR